jgi:pyruvate/2-oxoglutarate dehydrogenase complex dihydrolipoamide dehydrogenase (E3) component
MTVDVLIIGSGEAGVPLAVRPANSGRQVALVERAFYREQQIRSRLRPQRHWR